MKPSKELVRHRAITIVLVLMLWALLSKCVGEAVKSLLLFCLALSGSLLGTLEGID